MFSADRLRKTDREKVRGGQRIECADKSMQARGNNSLADPGQEVIQDRDREPGLAITVILPDLTNITAGTGNGRKVAQTDGQTTHSIKRPHSEFLPTHRRR